MYRYLFVDIMTKRLLLEAPAFGTWFSRALCRAGNATLSVAATDDVSVQDLIDATMVGRTKIYVERDGRIIWSGIIWTRTWSEESLAFSYTAQSLESYSYSQQIQGSLSFNREDQRNIVRSIFAHMQAKPYANIGLLLPDVFVPDILRTVDFQNYEGWSYGRALEYMVSYDQGMDYTIESYWDGDTIVDAVLIGNVIGRNAQTTGVVYDYPGDIKQFWWSESAAKGGTAFVGYGKGEGELMPRSYFEHSDLHLAGWPSLQRVYDNKDVATQATLDSQTMAYGKRMRLPVIAPTIELHSTDDLFDSWLLGDQITVNLSGSARFPEQEGMMYATRITGWELQPPSKGLNEEGLKLVLQAPDDEGTIIA